MADAPLGGTTSADDRVLTFSVGDRIFSLPTTQVREVVGNRRLTPVPQAPSSLLGLVNVRGTALPVLSLGKLLGGHCGRTTRIIILDDGNPVGLAVDGVATVMSAATALQAGTEPVEIAQLIANSFSSLASRAGRRSAPVRRQDAVTKADRRVWLISFAIGDQHFALPIEAVEAVIAVPQTIAIVPGAEAAVLGTADWRGALLPLLSLPILLGLPADASARGRILVVRIAGVRIGLWVDTMRDVLALDPALLDMVPAALARGGGETRIHAIARLDDGRRLVSVLAPDQLLAPDFTAALAQDAAGIVEPERVAGRADEPLLLFMLGDERYGLPLSAIDEIVRVPSALTPLPRAPGFVRGIMGLRGRALVVIDQSERFGGMETYGARAIVARAGDLAAAFLVDRIEGVVRVAAEKLAPLPALDGDALFDRALVEVEGGELILLMSAFALLAGTERAMLKALDREGDTPP